MYKRQVQTPTLRLVVDRDREIARFVSVPYWTVEVLLAQSGHSFGAHWLPPDSTSDAAGRCLQQPVAQHAADRIRADREARVVSVETERVREAAPLPFDLGTLQEVCSRQLGLDVQETLDIADVYKRQGIGGVRAGDAKRTGSVYAEGCLLYTSRCV